MELYKFRGKRICDGSWTYGYYLANGEKHYIFDDKFQFLLNRLTSYEVDPDTIGQFTGAYDRNGKEIYCGDVINDVINNYEYSVFWDTDNHSWHIVEWYNLENYEIVGNIHDKSRTNKEKV